jgi:hypothetical protein
MNKEARKQLIAKLMEKQEEKSTMLFSELPVTSTDIEDTVNGNEAYTEYQRDTKETLTSDEK